MKLWIILNHLKSSGLPSLLIFEIKRLTFLILYWSIVVPLLLLCSLSGLLQIHLSFQCCSFVLPLVLLILLKKNHQETKTKQTQKIPTRVIFQITQSKHVHLPSISSADLLLVEPVVGFWIDLNCQALLLSAGEITLIQLRDSSHASQWPRAVSLWTSVLFESIPTAKINYENKPREHPTYIHEISWDIFYSQNSSLDSECYSGAISGQRNHKTATAVRATLEEKQNWNYHL